MSVAISITVLIWWFLRKSSTFGTFMQINNSHLRPFYHYLIVKRGAIENRTLPTAVQGRFATLEHVTPSKFTVLRTEWLVHYTVGMINVVAELDCVERAGIDPVTLWAMNSKVTPCQTPRISRHICCLIIPLKCTHFMRNNLLTLPYLDSNQEPTS